MICVTIDSFSNVRMLVFVSPLGTLPIHPFPSCVCAAKDLVKRLLTVDPSKRASAKEALAHAWLQVCVEGRG